jgi:hypothetical protein
LRDSFFYGRTFRDLADLNAQCTVWLRDVANARVHGSTHAAPATRLRDEQRALRLLPSEPYVPLITVGRRVTRDGFVSYNGNDYSVPDDWSAPGTREVDVRATLTEVRLFQCDQLLAVHPLLEGRGARRLDPAHRSRGTRGAPPARPDAPEDVSLATTATLVYSTTAEPLPHLEVERRALSVYEQVLQ